MPKPADPLSDTLYDMPTLNRLFLASSLLLLVTTVWMAWQDYDRNWKGYQRSFSGIALKRAENEAKQIETAISRGSGPELELLERGIDAAKQKFQDADWATIEKDLEAKYGEEWPVVKNGLEAARKELAANENKIKDIEEKRGALKGPLEKTVQRFQFEKSEADTFKFQAESAGIKLDHVKEHIAELKAKNDPGLAHAEAELPGVEKDMLAARARFDEKNKSTIEAKREWEKLVDEDNAHNREIEKFLKNSVGLEKSIAKVQADLITKKRQIAKLQPSWQKELLAAPGVDFIAPPIKIEQLILPHFKEDLNFSEVFKVDRCTTCHLAIDKKGWTVKDDKELAGTPFQSHPNLDLYVGDSSPHPMSKFGCTICHNGQGRSVDFSYAAHTPKDAKQGEEWKQKYSWKPVAHYDSPMLPTPYVEASCTKCHGSQHRVTMAEKLNAGKQLVETVGCFGCHPIKGTEDLRKVGPSLYGVKYKVTKDWAFNWILDPTEFRPTTKMPKPFYLSEALNEKDREEVKKRYQAEIQGIVEYLWENENLPTVDKGGYPAPPAGDVARGKKVVNSVGCIGCHVVDQFEEKGNQYRSFGPNLSAVGSKLNPGWLYAWLKNPKQYFEHTAMPVLRLTDQEAADATAYLLTLKHPGKFEDRKAPEVDVEALDRTIIDFKKAQMSMAQAEAEVKALSTQAKLLWLGEKAVGQMGCFGCHDVKKFEKVKKIGAELTGSNSYGTKDITKFDFGFRHDLQSGHHPLPNDRINWIRGKLEDPRTYDGGRIVEFPDRLRMPKFNLSAEDIQNISTYVLSFRRETVNPEYMRNLSHQEMVIDRGKRQVTVSNCAACHKVGVWPTRLTIKDADEAPGEIWQKRVFAARTILTDGRQVDKISDEELAILKKKGIVIAVPKGSWITPTVVTSLYEKGITSILVYGENEGGIEQLVNLKEGDNKAPPMIVGEGARVNPDWLFRFLKSPSEIRPWLAADQQYGVRMPTFGFTDEQARLLVEHFAHLSAVPYPFYYEEPVPSDKRAAVIAQGKKVFEANQCGKCHVVKGVKLSSDTPAPRFAIVGARIQRPWFDRWIRDPQSIMPGTGMTQYNTEQVKPEDVTPLWEFIKSLAEPE